MKKLLISFYLCLMSAPVFAATGTCYFVYGDLGTVKTVDISWTSGTSSTNVEATTASISGVILGAEFVPLTNMPTSAYTVTLKTANGGDLFQGAATSLTTNALVTKAFGVNMSNGGTALSSTLPVFNGPLTFATSTTGDSKSGRVRVYYSAR
jgi:hypothetical protein